MRFELQMLQNFHEPGFHDLLWELRALWIVINSKILQTLLYLNFQQDNEPNFTGMLREMIKEYLFFYISTFGFDICWKLVVNIENVACT